MSRSSHSNVLPTEEIEPRRLELILNPEDGSLQTAPLLNVIMAATDGLYNDIYSMAHGELEVTSAQPAPGGEDEDDEQQQPNNDTTQNNNNNNNSSAAAVRKDKMASLSFAQRRHELAWRLASHSKALTHVAALTAANATTNMADATQISTRALQHARAAWVQADEAQDALYFFHAQLFPARAAPHDVYGALDTLLAKSWYDLPQDLQLLVDKYENSEEKAWNSAEVADRWNMAVRDKLLRGEMGWMKKNKISLPWKIKLRGGIVRLTHGQPKIVTSGNTTKSVFPIEAIVTVVSTNRPAHWTLVSVEVHVQAKTGQSNHQLDTSNRQRFDLHRLCALAMNKEEHRAKLEQEGKEKQDISFESSTDLVPSVARPLHTLYQVAHVFELSWQLEILSAQAQSLRKGLWATQTSNIVVTPVQFFENRSLLGILSISFWNVDDRYGPPLMSDLQIEERLDSKKKGSSDSVSTISRSINSPSITNQLTLSVRAEANVGIRVALSGAESIMEVANTEPHIRSTIEELLEATSNPFTISASEALLAATRLCAERKCYAMVQVLPQFLPEWISLHVEKGSIAVSARIAYRASSSVLPSQPRKKVVLFRLTCDARTGTFTCTFARSMSLLQALICNDVSAATHSTTLRLAQYAQNRRGGRTSAGIAAALASGRMVRDTFEGLTRSMNVLGQRTGVGGGWNDHDKMSHQLRKRAIELACKDARVSLVTCCGLAAVFGLSALSLSVATGISPKIDMAGGPISKLDGTAEFIAVPPLAILLDQSMKETISRTADGEKVTDTHAEQELFGICCSANDASLTLYGATIYVHLESPVAIPMRKSLTLSPFQSDPKMPDAVEVVNSPPFKRARMSGVSEMMDEVEYFASVLSATIGL